MSKNNKKEEDIIPFHPINKEKMRKKKENLWLTLFIASLIFSIIMFIVMSNQKDASTGAFVSVGLLIAGIISTVVSIVFGKKYITPIDTTEVNSNSNNFLITCPYCKSADTKKITTASKAIHTAFFGIFSMGRNNKQWHCNKCGSDF